MTFYKICLDHLSFGNIATREINQNKLRLSCAKQRLLLELGSILIYELLKDSNKIIFRFYDSWVKLPRISFWLIWASLNVKNCLPPKVVFHRRSFSSKCRLPLKVVLHWRLSSNKGCLPPKVVFHRRSSSTKGCVPPNVVFHWRSSSTDGSLPMKVVFPPRSSSTKGRLLP